MQLSPFIKEILPYAIAAIMAAWLIVCAIFDQKTQEVPTPLTLIPLIAAVLITLAKGNYVLAGLVIVIYLIGDIRKKWMGLCLAIIATGTAFVWTLFHAGTFDGLATTVVILALWLYWYFGKAGGADINILVTITLILGIWATVSAIIIGGLVAIVIWIALKKDRTEALPFVMPVAIGTIAYLVINLIPSLVGGII
jgi:prepilin signal peptidase PulO-like enzyme (type II secretory pathway)